MAALVADFADDHVDPDDEVACDGGRADLDGLRGWLVQEFADCGVLRVCIDQLDKQVEVMVMAERHGLVVKKGRGLEVAKQLVAGYGQLLGVTEATVFSQAASASREGGPELRGCARR